MLNRPAKFRSLTDTEEPCNQVQDTCQHHDGDGVQLRFAQKKQAQREDEDHEKIGASKHHRAPPQKALSKIVTPADAIIATTAGRSEPSTLWSTDKFRYLR